MYRIFESNKAETILIVDAENVFNSINRKPLLHNIEYVCPINVTFLYNCYPISARICSTLYYWWKRIKIAQRNNTGERNADGDCALSLPPLLNHLHRQKKCSTCCFCR